MTERVHGQMNLRALALLGPIESGAMSALWRALSRAAVDDHRGGFTASGLLDTAQNAQVMRSILEAPSSEPTVRLLAHRLCRREVVGEIGPLRPSPCHPNERVQDVSDRVFALPGIFRTEEQVRQQEKEGVVVHVAGVAAPCHLFILLCPDLLT